MEKPASNTNRIAKKGCKDKVFAEKGGKLSKSGRHGRTEVQSVQNGQQILRFICAILRKIAVTFSGNTRQVELEGEAYFEVTKDVEKPFIVRMNEYNVRVTGTQFNVRNYSNESLATTLVEGGVQIERRGKVDELRPGQQAVLENNEIRIRVVNVDEQVAWRHGAFGFTQCRLENIMEELARWYDVDVFYMNQQVKDYHFSAWFKRSSSINEVISILEKTKRISLDLKGRILTVKDISRN